MHMVRSSQPWCRLQWQRSDERHCACGQQRIHGRLASDGAGQHGQPDAYRPFLQPMEYGCRRQRHRLCRRSDIHFQRTCNPLRSMDNRSLHRHLCQRRQRPHCVAKRPARLRPDACLHGRNTDKRSHRTVHLYLQRMGAGDNCSYGRRYLYRTVHLYSQHIHRHLCRLQRKRASEQRSGLRCYARIFRRNTHDGCHGTIHLHFQWLGARNSDSHGRRDLHCAIQLDG